MNNFFKHIPGFRSNKTWKKIIASIYYFIALLGLFDGLGMFLFLLGMPFFIFSIGDIFKAKKNNKPAKATLITLVISLLVTSVGSAMIEPAKTDVTEKEEPAVVEKVEEEEESEEAKEEEPEEPEKPKKEPFKEVRDLKVHYINVGQGDSILIQLPNEQTMLIDGGPRGSSNIVVNYLKEQKIEKINYLVATHPHEDHIGGLPSVINAFDIGNIYMPDVTHTTKAFENLLLAIQSKGMKFETPVAGDILLDKEGLSLDVLAPELATSGDNLNNYSIALRLAYKDNAFLFTGDAEVESEQKMLINGHDLSADVLKVGHHGSNTATSNEFLNKVNPKYAVISCGQSNQYGHPHQATIDKLKAKNIEIYRTDIDGIIIATSNGEKITFEKKASTVKENAPPKQSKGKNTGSNSGTTSKSKPKPPVTDNVEEVYVTNTGAKYHRAGCSSLSKSKIPISLNEAKNKGYEPCKRCNPPK